MPTNLRLLRLAKAVALLSSALTPSGPGLTVLLYHRVGAGGRNIDLPASMFREQMASLREAYEVVPLAEGLTRVREPGFDGNLVAVTFDDGTIDLHEHALPALVEYRVPATLYACTGPVEERLPFPSWATGVIEAESLRWEHLKEMIDTDLVTIGSHTHSHADLDRASPDTIEQELQRSKDLIEQRLQRPCPDFAYPHAVTSPLAHRVVQRHYETAAIGGWRKVRAGAVDPYRITRVPVTRADGQMFFRAKVKGRLAAESWLYRIGGTRRD